MNRAALLAALIVAAVYAPTLRYALVWEDKQVITGNANLRWNNIWDLLTHSFWAVAPGNRVDDGHQHMARMWRPVTTFVDLLNHSAAGETAWPYHLANIMLHAGCTALLCLLLVELLGLAAWHAALWAVLWGLHPTHVDSVANVIGRTDLLADFFILAAVLAYQRGRLQWFVAACCLSLGSKEAAVALLPALLVLGWSRVAPIRLRFLGAGVLATAVFLWARATVLRDLPPLTSDPWLSALAVPEWALHHLGSLAWPWLHSALSSPARHDPYLIAVETLLAVLLLAGASTKIRVAGLLWFCLFALPSAWGAGQVYAGFFDIVSKRFVSLASVGIVFYLADLIQELRPSQARILGLSLAGFVLVAVPQIARCSECYRDSHRLWATLAASDPPSAMSHYNYGLELMEEGDYQGCVEQSQLSIAIDPSYFLGNPYLNLSTCSLRLGRMKEAVETLDVGLRIWPNSAFLRDQRRRLSQ